MWYVIQVQTRHEDEILAECLEKVVLPGESMFLMRGERFFHKDQDWEIRLYNLFPGYLFAETEEIDSFRIRLREVKKMTKVLRFGDEVQPIYPEEEAFLREFGGVDHIVRLSEAYKLGDRLVVTEGPLIGQEGRVLWIDRHHRMAGIEVELLGRKINVKLGLGILKKMQENLLPPKEK